MKSDIVLSWENERIKQVVRNNAVWCDTVCRVHGLAGEFKDVLWLNQYETPRFYPNAVTLEGAEASATQLEWIQYLLSAGIGGNWGVKDSFCTLNLVPKGFLILFEAQWLYRSASLPKPDKRLADVHWLKIEQASALMEWETAWLGIEADESNEKPPQIFKSGLLVDENVAVLAAFKNHRIVAGAIAFRNWDVVGLTNLFVPTHDQENYLADCIAQIMDLFGNLPIVGYEAAKGIASLQSLGFESLGPLRVWLKQS